MNSSEGLIGSTQHHNAYVCECSVLLQHISALPLMLEFFEVVPLSAMVAQRQCCSSPLHQKCWLLSRLAR